MKELNFIQKRKERKSTGPLKDTNIYCPLLQITAGLCMSFQVLLKKRAQYEYESHKGHPRCVFEQRV